MPRHIDTGKIGEDLAAEWLSDKGFAILARNWRYGRYEIDIIASKNSVIHIVEVKSRTSTLFGNPEDSVGRRKIRHIMQGATEWLIQYPSRQRLQYDVLAITLNRQKPPEYFLIQDVYL